MDACGDQHHSISHWGYRPKTGQFRITRHRSRWRDMARVYQIRLPRARIAHESVEEHADFAFTSFIKSREYEGHHWTYGLQNCMRSQVGRSTTHPRRIRCRLRSPHRRVGSRASSHMAAAICVALLLLTCSLVGCESYMKQDDLRLWFANCTTPSFIRTCGHASRITSLITGTVSKQSEEER
ncbi:hypothetical protein EDB84DRAFT_1518458 [Lactarius hengduanensis]|nr:hypothetical protein EDB84DRAFT_1518458 [Lactarius hengduanensis]